MFFKEKLKLLFLVALLIIIGGSGLWGCAARRKPPQVSASEQKKFQQELSRLNALHRHSSLSGFAQIEVKHRGRKESFDAAILLMAPDKLLIAVLDDLGQEKFRLVADGTRMLWYDGESGETSLEPQKGNSLKKVLHLPLTVEAFIARTLSQIPESEILGVQLASKTNPPIFEVTREQDLIRIQQDPLQLKSFVTFESTQRKKMRYEVSYADFEPQDSDFFSRSMQWTFKKPRVRIRVHFVSLELDRIIPLKKFETTPPFENGKMAKTIYNSITYTYPEKERGSEARKRVL